MRREPVVRSHARSIYLETEPGQLTELSPAGTTLENPYVYDRVAREIKAMADEGLVRIVREQISSDAAEPLIGRIAFARLR